MPTTEAMEAVKTAIQTGLQGVSADALEVIAVIVPIAIGIAGIVFVVRKAMGWFKGLAK